MPKIIIAYADELEPKSIRGWYILHDGKPLMGPFPDYARALEALENKIKDNRKWHDD